MKISIETDIGRDADDLFALIWLYEKHLDKIACVNITPGHPDQIAVVRALNKHFGVNIDIGASKYNAEKRSSNPFHQNIIKMLSSSNELLSEPDNEGFAILRKNEPKNYIVLGHLTNLYNYIEKYKIYTDSFNITMQGGFHPCSEEKFKDKEFVPTFNLSGDKKASQYVFGRQYNQVKMIGKNVGHFKFIFNESKLSLFNESSLLYKCFKIFLKYSDSKKLQDPLATLLNFYPEYGEWVDGKVTYFKGGWGTTFPGEHKVLTDINEEELWKKYYE